MAKHGGAIVNIVADMWGSMPGMGHSGAARAGMVSLTETAAAEWAGAGVRVNAVAPGYIASSGMDHYPPEAGPMLRASFEESVEVLMNAAAYAQSDDFTGVTENIMLGQLGQLGTGMVDLLVDTEKLQNAIPYGIDDDGMLLEPGAERAGGGFAHGQRFDDAVGTPYQQTPHFGTPGNASSYGFSATPLHGSFSGGVGQTPIHGDKSPGYASPYYSATPMHGGPRSLATGTRSARRASHASDRPLWE
jgi:hypothetical protein